MKYFLFISLTLSSLATWACSDSEADSLVEKRLYEMAGWYGSTKVGIGSTIGNGNMYTTNVIVFQGDGGTAGKIDRIGSITVDIKKCIVQNSLISIYTELAVPEVSKK